MVDCVCTNFYGRNYQQHPSLIGLSNLKTISIFFVQNNFILSWLFLVTFVINITTEFVSHDLTVVISIFHFIDILLNAR